jgi:hypothetical protein
MRKTAVLLALGIFTLTGTPRNANAQTFSDRELIGYAYSQLDGYADLTGTPTVWFEFISYDSNGNFIEEEIVECYRADFVDLNDLTEDPGANYSGLGLNSSFGVDEGPGISYVRIMTTSGYIYRFCSNADIFGG